MIQQRVTLRHLFSNALMSLSIVALCFPCLLWAIESPLRPDQSNKGYVWTPSLTSAMAYEGWDTSPIDISHEIFKALRPQNPSILFTPGATEISRNIPAGDFSAYWTLPLKEVNPAVVFFTPVFENACNHSALLTSQIFTPVVQTPVPEPGTLFLFMFGFIGLVGYARKFITTV